VTIVALVVAVADNGTIGRDGALPWHLPDDLRRFKTITMGAPVVMGRRTYESIGRPLPGRHNIVVSRNPAWHAEGVTAVRDLPAALAAAGDAPQVMIIGGAALYAEALPLAQRIYLTRVHAAVDGDVRFPPLQPRDWRVASSERRAADARHAYPMTFEVLERLSARARGSGS
jgi:dihydrofolate reductase